MIKLAGLNSRRPPHIWAGHARHRRINMSSQKQLALVLVLTSVFWIACDLLFLFYQQTQLTDLDSVILNGRSVRDAKGGKFTPPKPHEQHRLPIPREGVPTRENKINFSNNTNALQYYTNLPEVYSELVNLRQGVGGYPAVLPRELKDLSAALFKNHSFDSVLSKRISLNRKLHDYRETPCQQKQEEYHNKLPTTSVIICFHNEALTALLRTVHSVINRTPPHLLSDIILVDDASYTDVMDWKLYYDHLDELNDVMRIGRILHIKNRERQGLVRSRLKGSKLARGEVLTFLDSHCEVTAGWIEPLLDRIQKDRRNVVCPVIEVIDPENFSYKNAKLDDVTQVGGFTWDLFFNWKDMNVEEKKKRKDLTQPLKSPTMAGGLFSIDKQYFYEIGSYDEQMNIWGGENLEMSFRIWMCGGNLEIIPCSRVGHIFRKENSPYSFPDGISKTLARNFNRLAEVWMDEYKVLYYRRKPKADLLVNPGDISHRQSLRRRLNCKSFKWYLENIIPDIVGADPSPPAHGQLRNNVTDMCLDSMGMKDSHGPAKVYRCHGQGGNQFYVYTKKKEIIFNDVMCLDYSNENDDEQVQLYKCHGMGGNQEWNHDPKKGTIQHVNTEKCLVLATNDFLKVESCNTDITQRWSFDHYDEGFRL